MIYLDDFFPTFVPPGHAVFYNTIDEIPTGASIIGKAFYDGDHATHREVIQTLLPKTDKLILVFVEAVEEDFAKFIQELTDPKITVIINAVTNMPTTAKSAIAWFMCPNNFYNMSSGNRWLLTLVDQLSHKQYKPKYFDCLLGREKYHRTQIEKFYNLSLHKDKILFSYFKQESNITDGIWDLDVTGIPSTATSIGEHDVPLSSILPVSIYNQSYYSVVAETTWFNSHNQYTEKLAKPIVARRLFVAFASQHYLANLKQLGFKTFDSIIDESYDAVADLDLRLQMAWSQVEWLCEQDPNKILEQIQPIVEHNYNHFINTDWMANIRAHFIGSR